MPWSDALTPERMQRVALVAPLRGLRGALVLVADSGCVEFDRPEGVRETRGPAGRRLQRLRAEPAAPALSLGSPDLDALELADRTDLLAGEAQLEEYQATAVRCGEVAALVGWCPATRVAAASQRLGGAGGALVPLSAPPGVDPPTLARVGNPVRRSFAPLVRTYGTVPYVDVDPTWPAGLAYVVMFGVMFGDTGHGALLLVGALLLYLGRPRRLARFRPLWPFLAGAGLAGIAAGLAYGEFFGPTHVLPVLWLSPLDQPVRLLACAVGLGVVLLALAYAAGIANRWREGGPVRALYASSGIAGATVFLGLGLVAAGVYLDLAAASLAGAALVAGGLGLAAVGLFAATSGGAGGAAQTGVQLFDVLVRIGSNTISFTRLAAFGLTHAALGAIVWQGTTALSHAGSVMLLVAALVFVLGNVLTFSLEALVAGIQALRLEFYELFSRVFETEGRPFRPWHVPLQQMEVAQ